MNHMLGVLLLLGLLTGICVFADHSGSYCYYDGGSAAYYCEKDCDDNSEASIAGAVIGGVLAVATVIGITICISLHVNNKSHEAKIQRDNGLIIHTPNNIAPAQQPHPSAPPPPPVYMPVPPIGTTTKS